AARPRWSRARRADGSRASLAPYFARWARVGRLANAPAAPAARTRKSMSRSPLAAAASQSVLDFIDAGGLGSPFRVGRGGRKGQHRLAHLQALRPDDVGLVVDVLDDHREGALVLARRAILFTLELDAEAEHGAAFRQIDGERRLAQRLGIDAARLFDRARDHLGKQHEGVARRHADVGGLDGRAGARLEVFIADHLNDRDKLGLERVLV